MGYSTTAQVRIKAGSWLTTSIAPDTSSTALSLGFMIEEADQDLDEALAAGNYAAIALLSGTPAKIKNLSAIGAIAKTYRAIGRGANLGDEHPVSLFQQEWERGLGLLRAGQMDLGTDTVSGEQVTIPDDYTTWAALKLRGVKEGSVTVTNSAGTTTYVEDREAYQPGYRSELAKDYEVDHAEGRVRRLEGGALAENQGVKVSYTFYIKQPSAPDEAVFQNRAPQMGTLRRGDYSGPPSVEPSTGSV